MQKRCTSCREVKIFSEFGVDRRARDGRTYCCRDCGAQRARDYRSRNPEKALASAQKWAHSNKQKVRQIRVDWLRRNPGYATAHVAKRRAAQLRATPGWADTELTKDLYALAAVYRQFGHDVEVDHVVPLQSRLVCGLHVPANLTVVPSQVNRQKKNVVWPDMPGR